MHQCLHRMAAQSLWRSGRKSSDNGGGQSCRAQGLHLATARLGWIGKEKTQVNQACIRLVPLLPRSTHVPRQDVPAHTGESTQACTRVNARRRPPSFGGVSSAPACLFCLALHLSSAILSSRLAWCVVVYRRRGCLTLADTPHTHTRGGFVYFSTPRTRKG
ncbi:LOW QUALITY PROTEIN: hypothetical protein Q4I32_003013 [Leishmania shawi]|uniref:Uncharacterized protein n=1 Tax=Leishmania shawi TaxID=5680 RepID=A0AAW3C069_9TRYP